MTKDQLYFYIQTKKTFEFKFEGKTYSMFYDKDKDGNMIIMFGRLYEEVAYASYGELMNTAKIDNHFFKDILQDIN